MVRPADYIHPEDEAARRGVYTPLSLTNRRGQRRFCLRESHFPDVSSSLHPQK